MVFHVLVSGKMAAYAGGGYTGELVQDKQNSRKLLNHLKENNWLDSRSRALFVEATTYNAQVNLFTTMNLILEFLPTGGIETFSSLRIARLYTYGGSTEGFTVACQFFVLVFMTIFMYKEGKKIYREKRKYFSGFWNMVEFTIIVLVITTIGIFLSRMILVNQAVKSIQENQGKFVSFNKIVQWDTLFSGVSSIVVFLTCIKSLKLLQFNKTIAILASTLKGSAKPLAGFSIIFFVFFFAFTLQAYLLFMSQIDKFSSFITAIETVMGFLLGDFDFHLIESTKPIVGRMWFVLLVLFGSMYIMNVFLAIVMDTYSSVHADIMLQEQEYEIVDFMVNKFKYIIGRGDDGKKAVLDEIAEKERRQKERNSRKKNHLKRVSFVSKTKKKYYNMLDGEIEKKFAQLDNSLDEFWMSYHNEAPPAVEDYGCGIFSNHIPGPSNDWSCPDNPNFEFQGDQEVLLMQKELADELCRWS